MWRKCKCGSYAINIDPAREVCDVCFYKDQLLDLLAVIHRDGGQYTETMGLREAVAEAITLSTERLPT